MAGHFVRASKGFSPRLVSSRRFVEGSFQDDDETIAAGTVSFEAISRGGLTEHRRLGKTSDDDRASTASARSAKLGFDALRTIAQLQQQLA